MIKSNLTYIFIVVFLTTCKGETTSVKLDFLPVMGKIIKAKMLKDKIIVYYHSGDCSFCYGTITAIKKVFPEIPIISISASKNYELINYYMEQIGFQGISLIDSTSLFQQKNQQVLNTNNLFLIDLQFNILAAGENLDERTKGKFMLAIED